MRKQYSDYRAQSSFNRSVCPHRRDEEVDQPDLHTRLDRRNLRPRINNRHRERDAAEQECRRRYDEEYGVAGANRNSPDARRQISVVSLDCESYDGEDEQHRADHLGCNTLRAERRANDEAILLAEDELKDEERRNPRVACACGSPPRPRNMENEFVLDYDGHEVFTTPFANMAAVF